MSHMVRKFLIELEYQLEPFKNKLLELQHDSICSYVAHAEGEILDINEVREAWLEVLERKNSVFYAEIMLADHNDVLDFVETPDIITFNLLPEMIQFESNR